MNLHKSKSLLEIFNDIDIEIDNIYITQHTENNDDNILIKTENLDFTDSSLNTSTVNQSLTHSSSWANIIDEEYKNIAEKSLSNSVNLIENKKKNNSFLSEEEIEDIINTDNIKTLNDIKILEYQTQISNNIRKNVKNLDETDKNINVQMDNIIKKLKWLIDTTKMLCLNNNLNINLHKNPENTNENYNSIPRSSYKFCEYGSTCAFHYKKKKCYSHHYVYNIVYADMLVLLYYIQHIENVDRLNINEILKCTNTISYVISHMFDEYQNTINDKPSIETKVHKKRDKRHKYK